MNTNILDNTNTNTEPNFNTDTYTESLDLERKIQKLRDEDKAQKGRTWAFYEKLRKENPDLYRTAKTHEQMVKDAVALGTAFEDGDFHG
jgi:hypothetical protein